MLDLFSSMIPNAGIEKHYTHMTGSDKWMTIVKYVLVALALLSFLLSYSSRAMKHIESGQSRGTTFKVEQVSFAIAFVFLLLAGLMEMAQRIWMGSA